MRDNYANRSYLRISKESGCVLANYNTPETDEESILIPVDTNETSGQFKISKNPQRILSSHKKNLE